MRKQFGLIFMSCLLVLFLSAFSDAAEKKTRPAVLIVGGAHSGYFSAPLYDMGVEVDTCPPARMAQMLETRLYNVVVLPSVLDEGTRKAAEDFARKGGGVFVFAPGGVHHHPKKWQATNQWLAKLGARPRWEVVSDPDGVTDTMRMRLSYSEQIDKEFGEGVKGVLTIARGREPTGAEWPMSWDFDKSWRTVVRGGLTMTTRPSKDHRLHTQTWIPEQGIENSPPLLGVRELDRGRIGVVGIRSVWMLHPPSNCPTAEAMLTAGAAGKPSDWLKIFANTFRWLAAPSIKAGWGGLRTPHVVLHPPVKRWPDHPPIDWTADPVPGMPPLGDRPQIVGLVGARTELSSGSGTVAQYAAEARKAGLQFIIFLEDSLKMDQAKWDELVKQCAAASDDQFGAVPGITYEDAQGNHMFVLGDGAKFPKKEWLLPDGRLATLHVSRTEFIFAYVINYMKYDMINGFWNHKENWLHPADYKIANTFVLFSRDENGKPIDNAWDEFMYWQSLGGAQAIWAFEFMNDPKQVAERARDGWRVIATTGGPYGDGTYLKEYAHGIEGIRKRWEEGHHWYPPYQYLTNGPRILAYEVQNCTVVPHGEWWRPDLWQYRVRLHVTSEAGLKEVVIHEGNRRIFRRWLPGGAKSFEHTMSLTNCQQRDLVMVVTDTKGRRAISMELWNRNTMKDQFICGDRCNFLGRSYLRTKDGRWAGQPVGFRGNLGISPSKGQMDLMVQPDISTTLDAPTLPIDGRPIGAPEFAIKFQPGVPDELDRPFSLPSAYLIGPEIAIGQGNYRLGYDPAEVGAEKTRLGHRYMSPEKQGHIGRNAWTSWYRLIPLKKVNGWARIFAPNWLPGGLRSGWFELHWELIDDVSFADAKEQAIPVAYTSGAFEIWRDGKMIASPETGRTTGKFTRGTFAVASTGMVIALDDRLTFSYDGKHLRLFYPVKGPVLRKGAEVEARVGFAGGANGTPRAKFLDYARQFGLAGEPAYAARLQSGKLVDTYLNLRMAAEQGGVAVRLPRTEMHGFLTAIVADLNDNWSVHLLDHARKGPNHRGLPVRDGKAYAMLDLSEAAQDLFIGHAVTCNHDDVRLTVAWKAPGLWFVEAHNPTDKPLDAGLKTNPNWTLFRFAENVQLQPGSSKVWEVKER